MLTSVDGKKGALCRLDIEVPSFNDAIRHMHLVEIEILNGIYTWTIIKEV